MRQRSSSRELRSHSRNWDAPDRFLGQRRNSTPRCLGQEGRANSSQQQATLEQRVHTAGEAQDGCFASVEARGGHLTRTSTKSSGRAPPRRWKPSGAVGSRGRTCGGAPRRRASLAGELTAVVGQPSDMNK
jgi:hypothetical protein